MYYVVVVVILFFCYKILTSKDNALGWYVMGICLIYNGFHIGPLYSRFLFSSLLFFRAIIDNRFYTVVSKMPLKVEIFVFIIGVLISALMSSSYDIEQKFLLCFRELLTTILILPVSYFFLKTSSNSYLFVRSATLSLIILFAYGLFELISGDNLVHNIAIKDFNDYFLSSKEMGDFLKEYDASFGRVRIESLQCFSFDYGICSILLGLLAIFYYEKYRRKEYLIVGLICGLGGGILCGSRSVLLSCVIFYLLYVSSVFKSINRFVLYATLIIFVAIYSVFGGSTSYYYFMITDMLNTGGSNMGGSSVDMRMAQLSAAMDLFSQNPIWGNGPQYLSTLNENSILKATMLGSESYIYKLLIEKGIVGFITNIYFFVSVFRSVIKNRDKKQSHLLVNLTGSFLLFSLATGVQGAWYIYMPLLAFSLKTSKKYF